MQGETKIVQKSHLQTIAGRKMQNSELLRRG
jgi:hypothetical protein